MRHRTQAGDRRPGFTLIELLVVIAIIAVLAGLTTLGLGKVRQSALRASAASDISQLE